MLYDWHAEEFPQVPINTCSSLGMGLKLHFTRWECNFDSVNKVYLLLTINWPCSAQLLLTLHLIRIHHNCLSKGVAKSKPTDLLQSVSTPVKALCDGTPGKTFRTDAMASWYTQRHEEYRVEGQQWKAYHENCSEDQSSH